MNDNARAWVKALRSGEYGQCEAFLAYDGRYCCLGVACELAVKAGVIPEPVEDESRGCLVYGGEDYEVLPQQVQEWLGLRTSKGDFGDGDSLTQRNDDGEDFQEIADLIEGEPPHLFVE